MSIQGIGRVRIINTEQQFSMLLEGQKLADVAPHFNYVVRAKVGQRDWLLLDIDDKESLEYVKIMVEDNGVEEHTYQIMCGPEDYMLLDDQAYAKLMNSSDHVRKFINIYRLRTQ
jgi:hypothetical protein